LTPFSKDSFTGLEPSTVTKWRNIFWFGVGFSIVLAMSTLMYLGKLTVVKMSEHPVEATVRSIAFTLAPYCVIYVGCSLYSIRCRNPWVYGVFEVFLGIIIASYTMAIIAGQVVPEGTVIFGTIGALYIIVRGLDNMYRSITEGTEDKRVWNRNFFRQDTDEKL
jgi:hypothetical protein